MSTVYLVELETLLRVRTWTSQAILWSSTSVLFSSTAVDWSGSGGVFTKVLPDEILHVLGVAQDGVALTLAASAAVAENTPASWYYEAGTRTLTIQTIAGAGISTAGLVLLVTALEPLALNTSLVKTRNGTPVSWDGRVQALPVIQQALSVDELGAGAFYSLGELKVANEDGRYDRLIGERLFVGQVVRIYRGDIEDDYADFTLWLKGLVGDNPNAGIAEFTIPVVSAARRLDNAVVTTVFSLTTYPAMDPAIAGLPIPKVWGTVFGVEAYRIATGRWKVAGHNMQAITAAYASDGSVATITGTDLLNGEFTVSAAHDVKERLYVDCRGENTTYPGETIRALALDAGLGLSDLRVAELAQVDLDRPVQVGLRVGVGTYREALNKVAASAFIDWIVNRENVLTARIRRRDPGNLVSNPGFEASADGWSGGNGATVLRVTTPVFRGVGAGQIVKPAAQGLAHATIPISFVADRRYSITLMAALVSGATAAFRVGLRDGAGTEYLSGLTTLSSAAWTRVTVTVVPSAAGLYWSSTTVRFSEAVVLFSATGGALRVYPEYGGAGDVTVVIDDVQVAETVLLDDDTTHPVSSHLAGLVLWRVRVAYQLDARTGQSRFIELIDPGVIAQVSTAESREIVGALVGAADALLVAAAILAYYASPRMRFTVNVIEQGILFEVGSVADVQLARSPALPGGLRLFGVVGFSEETPGTSVPVTTLDLEGIYDPILDIVAIT